ncbi:methylenetetrahydrofolate reductase [NAD(P)H] [Tissierella carlieri]|uniref:methylenetetrahydrofolate reductase [NAD(P)H] n=1 Tax=Tissierella carlieri TaxID=689904 RepID=UPI001C1005D3|nr:methylenetetrahydrofolate reductase [NAD(P)H] [Tissierella carlieri]MBU5311692.1 methylenetetrahydrofolate reductase [NAD(P)H] [Tissierella carlieri]MDU5082277.1 methylenetetrahydrofolate reductase [NAD(P)H] [Bacillota bacterium]
MNIKQLFDKKNLVFSFEIFPPKPDYPIETVYDTIEELSVLNPDYISVTYGAGGSVNNNRTCQLSHLMKDRYNIESLAHLTCIGSSKEYMDCVLEELKEKGINNILALRGDIGSIGVGEFNNSQELIQYIKQSGDFGVAAACYPEGHIESKKDIDKDIRILKLKEEAGADYFISQLFFDNSYFYNLLDKAEQKGIKAPIQAGIMPVINKKQIERVISLCGASLPNKFLRIMNKYEYDKLALRDAGIAFALEQIVDLASSGIKGIHLYTMNNPYIAKSITNNIEFIVSSINRKKVI